MKLHELIPIERTLFGIDTETTGRDPFKDRIVELGFRIIKPDGSDEQRWSSYVNPGIPIPQEATFGSGDYPGHGITDDMVQGCRLCKRPQRDHNPEGVACPFQAWPTFAQIAPRLAQGFKNGLCDFLGYNLKIYDLPLLKAEFERAKVEWSYADARIIDGYRLWQLAQKRTLSDAVEAFLDRQHDGAHGAIADVDASIDVVSSLLLRFPQLPHTLDQLHQLQWPRDPSAIDDDGKFVWKNGIAVVNFGKKWMGSPLHKVDKGYLQWMLDGNFSPSTKHIAREALEGRLPVVGGGTAPLPPVVGPDDNFAF